MPFSLLSPAFQCSFWYEGTISRSSIPNLILLVHTKEFVKSCGSSLSNTAVVVILQILVDGDVFYAQTWGALGGIDPEKPHRATL